MKPGKKKTSEARNKATEENSLGLPQWLFDFIKSDENDMIEEDIGFRANGQWRVLSINGKRPNAYMPTKSMLTASSKENAVKMAHHFFSDFVRGFLPQLTKADIKKGCALNLVLHDAGSGRSINVDGRFNKMSADSGNPWKPWICRPVVQRGPEEEDDEENEWAWQEDEEDGEP